MSPRILVIRGGAIGDFILTLPAIGLLRDAFPSAHLEILGYRHIAALAERRRYADAVRSIEYGPLAGFFAAGGTLDPALAGYFASFGQIVSYLYDPDGIFDANLRAAGVKYVIHGVSRPDDSDHAARQLARVLESLALYLEDAAATFHPAPEDVAAADAFLGDLPEPALAIHPGSGSAAKNWPAERWEALLDAYCRQRPGGVVLLVGGEADAGPLARLEARAARLPHGWLARTARGLPLPHLGALLGRCRRFAGHDSGISHLAAAAGAPCTLLFGPTDPDVWAPLNRGTRVLAAPGGDLSRIAVEDVLDALEGDAG